MFKVISSILHLGNIRFEKVENANDAVHSVDKSDPKSSRALENFASMLALSEEAVLNALISRKFYVKKSENVTYFFYSIYYLIIF